MALPSAIADYLYTEVLRDARCLIVTLDEEGGVVQLENPWGDWAPGGLREGKYLPQPLDAILAATPPEQKTLHYPFVYLDDGMVVDVHVLNHGPERQLVLRDVTENHEAKLKSQQKAYEVSLLAEKLVGLNQQLEDQRAELERANQAKSRFIASMSHEFRTPITSIMGYADRLSQASAGNGAPAAIQRASWHLLTLVENLLEQARQGEVEVHLNTWLVDLGTLLQDLEDMFAQQARNSGLAIVVAAPPADVRLVTDELRLRQVLINLLGNAVRYTREGQVELYVRSLGDRLEFAVRDTGPGIGAEDRERIFKPFERLNPGQQTGAGLGLSIAQNLVSAMGGKLELDSEPGRGSTFRFSLALDTQEQDVNRSRLEGLKALVVDDDPDLLDLLELFLVDFGLEVESASNLETAKEQFRQAQFDVVVSDLFLNLDSGTELLEVAKAEQPKCKTLLCSGAGSFSNWKEHFGELADDFLLKPVQPENLRAALDSLFKEGS